MSVFDAITAPENLFRTTSSGQRVFALMFLVGRLAVVSDADALRVQRDVRRWIWWLVGLTMIAARVLEPWGLGAVAIVSLGIALAFRRWLARGLPTLSRREVSLAPKGRLAWP